MQTQKSFFITLFALLAFSIAFSSTQSNAQTFSKLPLCPDCNVIIIGLDALQVAHVSHLGYPVETTPTVDMFARQGTSFTQAISPSSWTVPSYMSIFTGLYPSEHKVVNKFSTFTKEKQVTSNLKALSPQVETLAETFKANGYVTGGFTGDAGVSGSFGYKDGFDIYTDEKAFGSIGNSATHALEWVEKNKDKKMFIFLHGYDDHGQFDLPDNYKGRFMPTDYKGKYKGTETEQRDLREIGLAKGKINLTEKDVAFWRSWYDSKIRDSDDRLKEFWEAYSRIDTKNKTMVVIVADHGTEFYEHGRFDHGFSLYDELVHVPLIFVIPGTEGVGMIGDQVTTLDVAPTILDITGVTPSKQYASQLRGSSLLSYLQRGKGEARDVFIETDYRDYTHKRGVRTTDGWKYILTMENGKEELYNLANDPGEQKNLIKDFPERASALKLRVKDHLASMGKSMDGPWPIGCVPVYGDQCK